MNKKYPRGKLRDDDDRIDSSGGPWGRAVADERERCANIAETWDPPDEDCSIQDGIAASIRSGK